MTLQEFFNLMGDNPSILVVYFVALPVIALLIGWISKGEGHLSPWRFIFSTLVFMVCIPGIFALTLNIYLFLFERRSVMQMDILSQILPVVSMVFTLVFIKRFVNYDDIPGFDKLSTLLVMITALMGLMWFVDRMHILTITVIPAYYIGIFFAVALAILIFGGRRILR